MDDRGSRMAETLRRVELEIPSLAPALWENLRGPVDDEALTALRAAVWPMPLPAELEVLLRWHDGQPAHGEWWPTLGCGPLLGADRIVDNVQFFRETEPWQWSHAWIPVAQEGWYQAAVDAVPERSGTVIDASWPDRPRAVAPSLADAIGAVVDIGRAGLLPTPDDDHAKREERKAFLDDLWQTEWTTNLLGRRTEIDPGTWPESWGGPQTV
jgi:cell wall assembly regulator SMI1